MKGVYQGMEGYYAALAQEQAEAEAAAIAANADPVETMLATLRAGLAEQARDHAGFAFQSTSNADLFVADGVVDLRQLATRIVHGRQP